MVPSGLLRYFQACVAFTAKVLMSNVKSIEPSRSDVSTKPAVSQSCFSRFFSFWVVAERIGCMMPSLNLGILRTGTWIRAKINCP